MTIDATEVEQLRTRISDTAQCMLDGRCSYIEGTRQILGMFDKARIDRLSEPFITFVAIGSATDEVPVGALREGWHPEAKIKLAAKWADAERDAKRLGEAACRDTIAWVAAHPFNVR
jgi:hypothetical protein